ncbi:IS3 family transposase [Corynebacterium pseudokroppenstedtii]|uniref:IS3 family transposase n=1 Tax=Corynebacterium pseudokroppenstedtii TaxID=2804917 RepID=UPI00307B05B2
MPGYVRPWLSTPVDPRCTYGYRRIKYSLAREGVDASEKVIRRVVKEDGIVVRGKQTKTRYSSYKDEIAPAAPLPWSSGPSMENARADCG